ncbi:hypothetical protein VTI74DRAFT_10800 [Chaetomium olivicolor]
MPPEATKPWHGLASICVILSINDWLNKWSANNWTATEPSDWNWNKEIVLVTGASGGIGASIVQQLLARNPRTKIVVVDHIPLTWKPQAGTSVSYYQCDLSDLSAVRALCSQIRSEVGHPTVLVNNAGLCRGFTVMEGTYHDVELTVRTNLVAPFLLIKEVLPHMVETNHGHIMNVSSMSSLVPPARVADYAATKAGINALHEALQLELKHVHNAPNVRQSLGIFSHSNSEWSRVLPPQWELWSYLNNVATKYDLKKKMSFGFNVERCEWIEESARWRMTIRHIKTDTLLMHECQFLFCATGQLVQAREIDVPGSDSFKGTIFHTSRWRSDVNLKDKKVVLFGNGCAAAQVVPSIVK